MKTTEWLPMETAPKDRKIWVHNGLHYGVAEWFVCSPQPATNLVWNLGDAKFDEVPNPDAGKIAELWVVRWASDDRDYDGIYTGPGPVGWMELPILT